MKNKLQRAEVLRILGSQKNFLSTTYGVNKLGIFGSVARNEASEASDVDVVAKELINWTASV